ncbi:MAG TPA: cbb3-type cytochrome c oxidase subunit I, partial [Blastocatellia bacterium]|nr:cbb3-type cytochrome c oxidase subunit I [Blastocatellia bacterium]
GILLLLEHTAGTSFFIPGGLVVNGKLVADHSGGSPIMWQHMFWFFGHPEVYIAIVPGMGLTSQLLSTFARKPIFGYRAMVVAIFAIGLLGFFVWGHHMFVSGLDPKTATAFSMVTLVIGVPSAINTFNWLGTLWGGSIRFTTAMLFAIGFVSLFVSGGITGLFLGQTSLDLHLHDTYFVAGHFHMIMGVAAIFGMFGGTYYWGPKMWGRMMSEKLGKIHFWCTFIGVNGIFIPMHIMGLMGAPRRYAFHYNPIPLANGTHEGLQYLAGMEPITRFISYAAFFTAAAQLIFFFNLIYTLFKGPKAPANPWEATTLEWTIPSPPPHDNFGGHEPIVHRGPYEYSVPGAATDFCMQTDAEPAGSAGD